MVVVDLDKKIVRKEQIVRRMMWKFNRNQKRVRFEKKVEKLIKTQGIRFVENFQG